MVLFDSLRLANGEHHAMWGLMPGEVAMQTKLSALGPQQWVLNGQVLRGHTFHYSVTTTQLPVFARTQKHGAAVLVEQGEAVYQQGSILASYFHPWFASNPHAVAGLFCREG